MIGLFSKEKREAKLEAAIRKEMAAGLYHRALPFFLERQRYAEAAAIEAKRGRLEEAAKLYERGAEWDEAAGCYKTLGDIESAAVALTKGDRVAEAAAMLAEHGKHAAAARLYLDLGQRRDAAEAYIAAGDLERAQDMYESIGANAEARQLVAQQAMSEGRWADAAEAYEALGDLVRAADAWDKADEPAKAAVLRADSGSYEQAVELRMSDGKFLEAAKLLAKHGETRRAAEAAFRAGELDLSVGYLDQLGDGLTIAKVYLNYGRREEAKQALDRVAEESPDFEVALGRLASLLVEDLNTKGAYNTLHRLVDRRLKAGGPFDEQLRRWIVEMVELLISHGKNRAALRCFDTLEQTGLLTARLERQRSDLAAAISKAEMETQAVGVPGHPAPEPGEAQSDQVRKLSSVMGFPQSERYTFTEKIGQGGNGAIYLARDNVLDREVVIKMIINTQLPSELAKKWFFREAQVSAKLNHPNIVTVYDLAEIDGQPYIAMEYVDGVDLADFLRDKVPLDAAGIMPILRQLVDALAYAHKQGVVHRDIKLENVMVTHDGIVKLMDFGLAKAIQGGTTTMVIAGTPAYMSPEQILGSKVDHRTDIYATGVMLFYMLTGRFPYAEGNVLEAHRGQPIPDPRDYVPRMKAGFEDIIFHAMAKKKEDRYDQIADMYRDFERIATR